MLVDCSLGVNLPAFCMPTPPSADNPTRYGVDTLRTFARELTAHAGLRSDIARDVADVLLDADLLGHSTHGLGLLSPYLKEIAEGRMAKDGEPKVRSRRAAAETWDGERLPGPWLTLRALDRAAAMARECGTGTVVIRRSHHIACLAAYLRHATEQGLIAVIESSDPTVAAVVPHGGITPFITPNPIAAGLPTSGEPIMIDVSTSITSMGYAHQQRIAGKSLPGPWLIDAEGNATADPGVLIGDSKGALLPLGGLDAGHKGFALAILIEALTAGLAGHGRADPQAGWGATVFVQVIDPEAFGGLAAFKRQMDTLADAAHNSKPRPGIDRVRLPGERGLQRYREQTAHGVALYPAIMPALAVWAQKYGIPVPAAIEA
jgi:LDH2 family malate/lactate/ureidoglycolate dehydrogenase